MPLVDASQSEDKDCHFCKEKINHTLNNNFGSVTLQFSIIFWKIKKIHLKLKTFKIIKTFY